MRGFRFEAAGDNVRERHIGGAEPFGELVQASLGTGLEHGRLRVIGLMCPLLLWDCPNRAPSSRVRLTLRHIVFSITVASLVGGVLRSKARPPDAAG